MCRLFSWRPAPGRALNTHERFERGLSCQLLRPELKWASRARPVSRLDHKAQMPEAGSAHFKCRAGPILFTPCAIHSIHSCSFLRLGGTPVLQMLGTPQCVVRLDGCKCTHVPVHNGIWFGRLGRANGWADLCKELSPNSNLHASKGKLPRGLTRRPLC